MLSFFIFLKLLEWVKSTPIMLINWVKLETAAWVPGTDNPDPNTENCRCTRHYSTKIPMHFEEYYT
jgi:hypothetical protein